MFDPLCERCSTPGINSTFAAEYERSLSVTTIRGVTPWPLSSFASAEELHACSCGFAAEHRERIWRLGIAMTAYAPLAQGRAAKDPVLARIGEKHSATAAQIAIAWLLDQENVIAIPKAARQRANLDALNIDVDDEDRAAIAALPKDLRYVDPPFAPDWEAPTL